MRKNLTAAFVDAVKVEKRDLCSLVENPQRRSRGSPPRRLQRWHGHW